MEEGHLQSVADLMATRGRPRFTVARIYVVSDLTWSGLPDVDVGWGRAVYCGPPTAMLTTFHIADRNVAGEEGVEVLMRLPVTNPAFTANHILTCTLSKALRMSTQEINLV
ncbi:hypothetical protein ABZP36_022167 [Zizania latifolia]